MRGLPAGTKYRLAHVTPTTYNEDGTSADAGFYQFTSEPVLGKVYNVVIRRDLFWFGWNGPYTYDTTFPPQRGRSIARLVLWSRARDAWGCVSPVVVDDGEPSQDDCGCGCDCCGGGDW